MVNFHVIYEHFTAEKSYLLFNLNDGCILMFKSNYICILVSLKTSSEDLPGGD